MLNDTWKLIRKKLGKVGQPTEAELYSRDMKIHAEAVEYIDYMSKHPKWGFDPKPLYKYLETRNDRGENPDDYSRYRRRGMYLDEFVEENGLEEWLINIPPIVSRQFETILVDDLMSVNDRKYKLSKVTNSDQKGSSLKQRFQDYLKPKIEKILKEQNGGLGDQVYATLKFKQDVGTTKFKKVVDLSWGYGHGSSVDVVLKPNWKKDVADNGIAVVDQCLVSDAKFEYEEEGCKVYKATWWSKHLVRSSTHKQGDYCDKEWQSNEGYIGIMGDPDSPLVVKKAKAKKDIVNIVRRWGTRRFFNSVFDED